MNDAHAGPDASGGMEHAIGSRKMGAVKATCNVEDVRKFEYLGFKNRIENGGTRPDNLTLAEGMTLFKKSAEELYDL